MAAQLPALSRGDTMRVANVRRAVDPVSGEKERLESVDMRGGMEAMMPRSASRVHRGSAEILEGLDLDEPFNKVGSQLESNRLRAYSWSFPVCWVDCA